MSEDPFRLLKDSILAATEASLEAQLRAIRKLRADEGAVAPKRGPGRPPKRMSHVAMALDILKAEGKPCHLQDLRAQLQERFGVSVDRDSLGSALAKRLAKDAHLERVAPNTYRYRP